MTDPLLADYYRQYGLIVIFTGLAVFVPASMLLLSWLLYRLRIRPYKPTPTKLDTYECGMQTVGGRWERFNFRYYLYALLFVIFDVEAVFLFPWAVEFQRLGLFALVEMLVFLGILTVGWAYAWRKGALQW
ncbi:MAG: NADH-quinone oxidoreductase subunit A [Dehalococcoidia bacterium]|nr:NADH-quinone oxidoreductase subunit A [Dehalococcoidia bacterium]MDW8119228.1 NADH-quinone oxidoreductase subunit A [Chloroflexota bacterium]